MLLKLCLLIALFSASLAQASVALVQYNSSVPSATSGTVAFSSSVTSGDLLFYIVTGYLTSSATPTDTLSTAFSLINTAAGGSSSNIIAYVGKAGSSGADTVSFSGINANNVMIMIEEWSGAVGVSLSNVAGQDGSSYSLTNSYTPLTAQGGVMLVYASETSNNTTFTFSGGTIRAQSNPPAVLSCMVGDIPISRQTTVNTLTVSMTLASGGNGVMGMIYLEPAASGGSGAANSAYTQ